MIFFSQNTSTGCNTLQYALDASNTIIARAKLLGVVNLLGTSVFLQNMVKNSILLMSGVHWNLAEDRQTLGANL